MLRLVFHHRRTAEHDLAGHLDAQAICGNMYDLARGVAKDERLAFVCYEKAAEQGHMVCQYNLGIRYREGLGCEKKFEQAAYWFEQASDQGHPNAMSVLGSLYSNGQGVPRSKNRGFELLQQSRALGNTCPSLHYNLGICYDHGYGVTKDYLEARQFYAMASAQGFADNARIRRHTSQLNQLDEKIRAECPLLGKRVLITGTSREKLNGRTGATTFFDHARVRYVVELDDDAGESGIQEKLKLKPGLALVRRKLKETKEK